MRILKITLLVVLGLGLLTGSFLVWQIGPRNVIGMLRYDVRREGDLKVRDRAPDVTLERADGSGREALYDYVGGKPLVLVFGSYT